MAETERAVTYHRADFTLDAMVKNGYVGPLKGWTTGELWNGWAVPYFEYEEAERVVEEVAAAELQGRYDRDRDAFVFVNENEQEQEYAAESIDTPQGQRKAYPIGAREWIWDFAEPEN